MSGSFTTPLLVISQALQCQGLGVLGLSPGQGRSTGIGLMWGRCARGLTGSRVGGWKLAHNPALRGCASVALRGVGLLCSSAAKSRTCMWGRGRGVRAGQRGAVWGCGVRSCRVRDVGLCSVVHKVMPCGVQEGLAPQQHPPGDAQTPPRCAPSPHRFWRSPQTHTGTAAATAARAGLATACASPPCRMSPGTLPAGTSPKKAFAALFWL